MRRFRNIVIGGIENKLINLILIAVALIGAGFVFAMVYQGSMVTGLVGQTRELQQQALSENTGAIVDDVVSDSMTRATRLEAALADDMFSELAIRVRALGDMAQALFDAPGGYAAMPIPAAVAARDGELSAMVLFAEGVDASDEALNARLGLISNLSGPMLSLCRAFGAENAYIALPEGATLTVNARSGSWAVENGAFRAFDPRGRDWYRQAVAAGELIFTDVDIDSTSKELCVTCAMPVYSAGGTLEAVVGADLFLTRMRQAVQGSAENGGFVIVVNGDGHVLFSPRTDGVFSARYAQDAPDLRQSENAELAALVNDALQGVTQVRRIELDEGSYYMVGVPMRTPGWSVISAFDEAVAAQPAQRLRQSYAQIDERAAALYRERMGRIRILLILMICALLAAICTGALIQGKRIVKPLNDMTRQICDKSGEKLDFDMREAYRTGDEIQVLAEAFADLSHRAANYVDQVRRATAQQQRIDTELHTANMIQESMLPGVFPPFPDRREFDLYATMEPAREVGGDFYDFFLIDDDHLGLVVADVSGKGVPAALFMMVSKVILQSCAMLGRSAGEILEKTNEALCSNNRVEMFVTVWLGILEISTGRLTAANAGHEYPVLARAGGRYEKVSDRHGFVLGGMPRSRYREYALTLNPGDRLFLYTDGIPEATDGDGAMFGMDRMIAALNEVPDAGPEPVIRHVRKAVGGFVGDAEQFDDMTMLCFEYRGRALPGGGEKADDQEASRGEPQNHTEEEDTE